MGASHTIKLAQSNGQDVARGVEANDAPASDFVLVTDENDRLFCPGVNDEPSEDIIVSLRETGWEKGSLLRCVNRGKKGGALVLVVADGRSRLKAVRIVNAEREAAGLPLIRPQFVLMTEDEAYEAMHTSHNKQERRPSFDARCWGQFKRIYALEKLGKSALEDAELRDCRKAYAKLRKCSLGQVKTWETILSAHPDVLRMFDAKEPGINRSAVIDIVDSTEFAAQPEAARRVSELAKARKGDAETAPALVQATVPQTGHEVTHHECGSAPDFVSDAQPEKQERRTRSEKQDRQKALGIASSKSRKVAELRDLAAALRRSGKEEHDRIIAVLLWAANDESINDDAALDEVFEEARKNGWKS